MAETSNVNELREVKSCGFLVMKPDQSFLLMSHKDRYDLPKGHMEVGETEQQTALRGKLIN
jgi:8-oxo-dGTP pyrophosphatase MutT (NUDIX family)